MIFAKASWLLTPLTVVGIMVLSSSCSHSLFGSTGSCTDVTPPKTSIFSRRGPKCEERSKFSTSHKAIFKYHVRLLNYEKESDVRRNKSSYTTVKTSIFSIHLQNKSDSLFSRMAHFPSLTRSTPSPGRKRRFCTLWRTWVFCKRRPRRSSSLLLRHIHDVCGSNSAPGA